MRSIHSKLTDVQKFNMQRTINNMRHGADALIDPSLITPMTDENSKSVLQPEVARHYTDQLATMIKKKFVAGPFDSPPFPNFRTNSLFAVNQSDKYRPILNLSKPDGNNFNEAIIPSKMRKVNMSTARQFAATLRNTGQNSIMSKLDHVSAYKLVPVKPEQFYLQGFKWLGKYFVEVRLIFGARSSVPNYDDLHQTVSDIVKIKSGTDRQFLHRTLDDQVIVTPNLELNKAFINTYLDLANYINLPLADTTGQDKAFLYRTSGTVLGIFFDTKKMSWTYNNDKRLRHMAILQSALTAPMVSLDLLQKVMGVVNTLMLLCPLLRFLRAPFVKILTDAYSVSPIHLNLDAINFLHLWLHIFESLQHGFPIPKISKFPPAIVQTFVTDAAGHPDPDIPLDYKVGVGTAGYINPCPKIIYLGQALWPPSFLPTKDVISKFFGRKTTLLEAIGLILPLYHNIPSIMGTHIVLKVDNLGTVWAYEKGRSKEDPYTSVIMTALNHIAVYFSCKLYVTHCPRLSCEAAVMADLLTRTNERGMDFVRRKKIPIMSGWPPSLLNWMYNPTLDWNLGVSLVDDFKAVLHSTRLGFSLFGMDESFFSLFGRLM